MATPFRIVLIDMSIDGGTRVQWDLVAGFNDPTPYYFQLQKSEAGNPDADDWENVGAEVQDVFYAIDEDQQIFGKSPDVYYRIIMRSGTGTYISGPASIYQWMHHYQWRMARDILRKERLRHRMFASIEGYLLIRRRYGTKCPDCLDSNTDEIIRASDCPTCFGTGVEDGYFDAMPAYADISLRTQRTQNDMSRGTSNDIAQTARFLGYPILRSYDVWVNKHSDERYFIHTVSDAGRIGNTPIIQTVELRLAPYSDQIYTFQI